ncbi:MAG TPA: hypothetical protein EYP16_04485 [Candidatus Atribacteria bacterium]|nr:hypothetical protein [Candidatus Atribacteria bacterium]
MLYDDKWNEINRIPVRNLAEELKRISHNQTYGVVFDGVVTQRIIDIANEKNVKVIIGARIGNITKRPVNLVILSFKDLIS